MHRFLACLALAVAAAVAAPAAAHRPEPAQIRELIRVQGFKAPAPRGVTVTRELGFVVLGQTLRFAVTEWQTFAFADSPGKPTPAEPAQIALQGDRALLRRVTGARSEQRITLLAERRLGSSDVFVVSADLCPPQ